MRKKIKALEKAIRRGRLSQVAKILFEGLVELEQLTTEERAVVRRANIFCTATRLRQTGDRPRLLGQRLKIDPVDGSVTIRNN